MINRNNVVELKRDLDRLISDSEKLAFLLDEIEQGSLEIVKWRDNRWHFLSIEEIEEMLENRNNKNEPEDSRSCLR